MKIALVGNQNAGKSTIFNIISSSYAQIGNRPGVTINITEGRVKNSPNVCYDLPGIYSLSSLTSEEKTSVDFLKSNDYDLILNIIDSTNLFRSLNLTLQLLSLGKPVGIVLNMADNLKKEKISIDIKALEKLIGSDVILFSAKENSPKELIDFINKKHNSKKFNFSTAEERFDFIKRIIALVEKRQQKQSISNKIDKIVLNKFLALPIFFLVMLAMYWLSVGFLGMWLSDKLAFLLQHIVTFIENILRNWNVAEFFISLLIDGMLIPINTVICFLPQIGILFLVLSILESIGYLTRAAFIFDRLFSAIGLSGKSIIPFIIGSGCTVPAILSCKTIEEKNEKAITMMLSSFIPCSAKLPIIALFVGFFFNGSAFITLSFYILAIILIIIFAIIFSFFNKGNGSSFVYELTSYKAPHFKQTIKEVSNRIGGFFIRVGTTILTVSVVIWFLSNFSLSFVFNCPIEDSILASIGKLLSPAFSLVIGENSWQATVSAIQGLIAKEQVISSMAVIAKAQGNSIFESSSFSFFNSISAYSFIIFNLFSPPCINAIATLKKEIGIKRTLLVFLCQLIFAFLFSSFIFQALTFINILL